MNVDNQADLKRVYLEKIKDFNFNKISEDVKELLFIRGDISTIINFYSFFEQTEL